MADEMPLEVRLRALARHLDAFEAPGFTFGRWVSARTDADGVIHMGWYEPSPGAEAFLADVRSAGWVTPVDWMGWLAGPDGQRLSSDPSALAGATAEQLGLLLTSYIRGERFGDGTLAAAHERGMLTAVMRRARDLLSRSGA